VFTVSWAGERQRPGIHGMVSVDGSDWTNAVSAKWLDQLVAVVTLLPGTNTLNAYAVTRQGMARRRTARRCLCVTAPLG